MSYEIDIPIEVRPNIKLVMDRNNGKITWPFSDLRFIMLVYYRYIARLYPGETPESRTKQDITCNNCRVKALGRVRMEMLKWQDE